MKILLPIIFGIFVAFSTACSNETENFSGVWRFHWQETDKAIGAGYTEKQKEKVVHIKLNFKEHDILLLDYSEMVGGLPEPPKSASKVQWKEDGSFWVQLESGPRKTNIHFEIRESGLLYLTFPLEPGLELEEIVWVFTKEGVNQTVRDNG